VESLPSLRFLKRLVLSTANVALGDRCSAVG